MSCFLCRWIKRLTIASLLLMLLGFVGYRVVLPGVVDRQIRRALADVGWPEASFRLVSVDLWHIELADFKPDRSQPVWLARLQADYAIGSLVNEKRVQHVRLIGLRPRLSYRDGVWDFGPLAALMTGSSSSSSAIGSLPFRRLSIEDSTLELELQGHRLTLPMQLDWSQGPAGQWGVTVQSESAIPIRLDITLDLPSADSTLRPVAAKLQVENQVAQASGTIDLADGTISLSGQLAWDIAWQMSRDKQKSLAMSMQGATTQPAGKTGLGEHSLTWSPVSIQGKLALAPAFSLAMEARCDQMNWGPLTIQQPAVLLKADVTQATLTATAEASWDDGTVEASLGKLAFRTGWQRQGDQDVFSGFVRLDDGKLSVAKRLTVDRFSVDIPWRYVSSDSPCSANASSALPKGSIQIRGLTVRRADEPTAGLKVSDITGTAWLDQGQFHLDIDSDPANQPQLQAEADLDLSRLWSPQGKVHATLFDLAIDDPAWFGRMVPQANDVQLTGQFQADFVGQFQQGAFRPWLTLTSKNVTISSGEYDMQVQGLETSVHVDSFSPISTPPSQWVTVQSARMGKFQLADGLLQFTMQAPDSYLIERTRWRLGQQGRFWVHSFWLDPLADQIDLEVFLEEMDLSDWVGLFSDKVHGQGRMYGRLPVTILPKQARPVRLGQGFLYGNPEGGFIQMSDASTAENMLASVTDLPQQVQQRAIQAIQDFQYRWLKLELVPHGADTSVRIVASGQGRQSSDDQPAVQIGRFEVNIHGLNQAINEMLLVKRASDQVLNPTLAPKHPATSPAKVK